MDIVRSNGDVRADVAAEAFEKLRVMVAQTSRMNLHNQTVVQAHGGHFGKHLSPEAFSLARISFPRNNFLKETIRGIGFQSSGRRRGMAVIRRGATESLEFQPPLSQCEKITLPIASVRARHLPKPRKIFRKAGEIWVNNRVGSERGNDPSFKPRDRRCTDGLVIRKRVQRRIRGRQHFQLKSFKQGAGTKRRRSELLYNNVEIFIGVCWSKPGSHPKELMECEIQPKFRRRAAEKIVMLRKNTPDRPRIFHGRCANPEVFEWNTLAVKHAQDVVVGNDKQLCGVRKGLILRKPAGIRMAVRAEDGHAPNAGVEPPGDGTCSLIRWEQPVRVKRRH